LTAIQELLTFNAILVLLYTTS